MQNAPLKNYKVTMLLEVNSLLNSLNNIDIPQLKKIELFLKADTRKDAKEFAIKNYSNRLPVYKISTNLIN
jgi:uncharacterized protein (DUF488 family)